MRNTHTEVTPIHDAKKMIMNMIKMQIALNNETNGTCWINGITNKGKDIDWALCMEQEISEAIDSFPWKHWKNIDDLTGDMDNLEVEIVDIMHFIISFVIRELILTKKYTNADSIISHLNENDIRIKETYNLFADNLNVLYTHRDLLDIDASPYEKLKTHVANLRLLRTHISGYVFPLGDLLIKLDHIVVSFYKMISVIDGFDIARLYKLYISKNTLNKFRQNNGYKEGTYIKEWRGREDNTYITSYLETNPTASPEDVYSYLEAVYSMYKKELEKEESN